MTIDLNTQRAIEGSEAVSESPFYIPMKGPTARPRRVLKHNDTFVVLDSHGDIGASAGGPDGLFNRDTRYLARCELVLDDTRPLFLGSSLKDDNSALTVDLTNPDIYRSGRIVLHKDVLHILRTIFLWRDTAYQRVGIENHGDRVATFDLSLLFDNDFADLFEVRGERRARRGTSTGRIIDESRVVLSYRGLDDRVRSSLLQFDPAPTRLELNSAVYRVALAPHQDTSLFLAVGCNAPEDMASPRFFPGLLAHRREMHRDAKGAVSIETSNDIFNEVLCQAMADLNMLTTETPQGRYPYAGIPWYSTTFGRDGLIAAILFAPAGDLVPQALRHTAKGGTVVCAGIHMSNIPEFPYALLWGERCVRSIANLTRHDGEEFFAIAPRAGVRTEVSCFALAAANDALQHLRAGEIRGAAVLIPDRQAAPQKL